MAEGEFDLGEKTIYGVLWPPWVNQEGIDALPLTNIRDDDVMVVTFPKAGTHWLSEIVSLIHVNGEVEKIDREETCGPLEFVTEHVLNVSTSVEQTLPGYMRIKSWKSPRVLTTHAPEEFLPKELKKGKGKIIYVIRNPKDIAVSYWSFLRKRRKHGVYTEWNRYISKFIEGKATYGPWYRHVKQYWERYRDSKNVLFIYYEDLKKDHRAGIVQISNFIGRPLSEEAIDKIVDHSSLTGMSRAYNTTKEYLQQSGSSSSEEFPQKRIGAVDMIRKGIVGDWKNHFTVNQNELFDSVFKKEIDGTGLRIEYE